MWYTCEMCSHYFEWGSPVKPEGCPKCEENALREAQNQEDAEIYSDYVWDKMHEGSAG